jgi:hypothetical protein
VLYHTRRGCQVPPRGPAATTFGRQTARHCPMVAIPDGCLVPLSGKAICGGAGPIVWGVAPAHLPTGASSVAHGQMVLLLGGEARTAVSGREGSVPVSSGHWCACGGCSAHLEARDSGPGPEPWGEGGDAIGNATGEGRALAQRRVRGGAPRQSPRRGDWDAILGHSQKAKSKHAPATHAIRDKRRPSQSEDHEAFRKGHLCRPLMPAVKIKICRAQRPRSIHRARDTRCALQQQSSIEGARHACFVSVHLLKAPPCRQREVPEGRRDGRRALQCGVPSRRGGGLSLALSFFFSVLVCPQIAGTDLSCTGFSDGGWLACKGGAGRRGLWRGGGGGMHVGEGVARGEPAVDEWPNRGQQVGERVARGLWEAHEGGESCLVPTAGRGLRVLRDG